MQRYIYLAAIERRVTLGAYCRAVRLAKAHPDAEFKHGLATWYPTKGADIVRQFRSGIHDRINAGIPAIDRGTGFKRADR